MPTTWRWIGYLGLLFVLFAFLPVTKDRFVRLIKDTNDKIAAERIRLAVFWLGAGVVIFASYVVLRMVRSGML